MLGPEPVHHPWERDRFPKVRKPANPGHRALETKPEPRVNKGPVFTKVEVPAVRIERESLFLNPVKQLVVVVLAL